MSRRDPMERLRSYIRRELMQQLGLDVDEEDLEEDVESSDDDDMDEEVEFVYTESDSEDEVEIIEEEVEHQEITPVAVAVAETPAVIEVPDPPAPVLEIESEPAPTSAKKRKRSISKTPVKGGRTSDDDDDGTICPICLEEWELSGEHRIVSLKCGHLFGMSCIKRWLRESGQNGARCCPQCKTKATARDIRCLYAKRLRALDRTEEYSLREKVDFEKARYAQLQAEHASLQLVTAMNDKRLEALRSENERLKEIIASGSIGLQRNSNGDRKASYKLYMDKNIEISKEAGSRVMIYASQSAQLIVSQRSVQNLFPGFGVRFIDAATFRPQTFLHTSAKSLRDIALNETSELLATASMEARSKMFDLNNRSVVATFAPSSKPIWACAMDKNDRSNILYLGAQHGTTYTFDVRNPNVALAEFEIDGDLSPVINICPFPVNNTFPCGGFIVCKLQSVWFFEYTPSQTVTHTKLGVDGPFMSADYDTSADSLLISTRNSFKYPQSRYMAGKMTKINDMPVFDIASTFFGSKVTPIMTRCSQISLENNLHVTGYIQDAKVLSLFDSHRMLKVQSLAVSDVVYDTCPIRVQGSSYLAALTETKCRIYKFLPSQ